MKKYLICFTTVMLSGYGIFWLLTVAMPRMDELTNKVMTCSAIAALMLIVLAVLYWTIAPHDEEPY